MLRSLRSFGSITSPLLPRSPFAAAGAPSSSLLPPSPVPLLLQRASSVWAARKQIFGHWSPKEIKSAPFTKLKRLRYRGWIGESVVAWNKLDPAAEHLAKHPAARSFLEERYRAQVDARRNAGKGPPKKGAGKRAKKSR